MVYDPPKRYCPNCGNFLFYQDKCSYCGWVNDQFTHGSALPHANIPQNYSGSITLTSSASRAIEHLNELYGLIRERQENEPAFSHKYQFVRDLIIKQDVERIKEKPEHIIEYEAKVIEYKKLIDNNAEEPLLQSFFEQNPNFLIADQIKCEPKPNFGGELEPDFIIEASNLLITIIEIEKPAKHIFRKNNQPTAILTQAQKQMRDFLKWARDNRSFLRERGWNNISEENTKGLIIIGKKENLTPNQIDALTAMNHELSSYSISTFDDIYNENFARLQNWKSTNI